MINKCIDYWSKNVSIVSIIFLKKELVSLIFLRNGICINTIFVFISHFEIYLNTFSIPAITESMLISHLLRYHLWNSTFSSTRYTCYDNIFFHISPLLNTPNFKFTLSSNTPIIPWYIQFFYMLFYLSSMLWCLNIILQHPLYLVLHGFLGILIKMHSHTIHCATYHLPKCYRCVWFSIIHFVFSFFCFAW